jgi:hypothetical protein
MRFLPTTNNGRWASGLSIAFIILIIIKIIAFLPLPTFVIAAIGLVGFILGIIAVFKNKDRTILNFAAITVGLIIMLWTAAELVSPH